MKRALLTLGMFLSMLSAVADDNVLQTIEIVPVKDTYNIVLTSDKAVDVKKTVKAPNQISLNLKDIRASKSLNTIYNNVSNVDTVMVEPSGNGISIFFQAENAQGASVSFDSIAPVVPVQQTNSAKEIKLSNPIESYAPIYKEDIASQKTSPLFDKLKKSSEGMIDEDTVSDTANKAFSFGLIGLLAFCVIRLFKRREPDMKIGLSQSLTEREIGMYKGAQHFTTPVESVEKPFTSVNYGLNAYQRESRNPYETENMPIHNPRLRNYTTPSFSQNTVTMSEPAPEPRAATQTMVQQTVRKHTTPVNTAPVNQSNPNVDNLKFLESMTAIYEKSGRHDLARGLKASLNKNNIKQ